MKKFLALILVLVLALSVFAGCNKNDDKNDETEAKDYALAIGVEVTNNLASAKSSQTVATVVIDSNNKIVACRIDAIDFTATEKDGAPVTAAPLSKADLGDNYKMVEYSSYTGTPAIAEWYVQAAAFEAYVVGKTLAEVKATALNADGKPTDAELTAGCTIDVTDFIKAVENAFASTKKVSFKTAGDIKLGVSAKASEIAYTATGAKYEFACDFSGVVLVDGKVVSAIIDSTAVTATTTKNEAGNISATNMVYAGTKLDQGDDYKMVEYSGYNGTPAIAEWYVQAQVYANTTVGKTVSELASLAIEGVAGCTIKVDGYKVALEAAAKAAR